MSLLTFAYNVRYAYPWWKEKIINSDLKRKDGLCPLTPEETALILRALDIDQSIQIYIAAGEIYGGDRRMSSLAASYPNLVSTYCKKYLYHFSSIFIFTTCFACLPFFNRSERKLC